MYYLLSTYYSLKILFQYLNTLYWFYDFAVTVYSEFATYLARGGPANEGTAK